MFFRPLAWLPRELTSDQPWKGTSWLGGLSLHATSSSEDKEVKVHNQNYYIPDFPTVSAPLLLHKQQHSLTSFLSFAVAKPQLSYFILVQATGVHLWVQGSFCEQEASSFSPVRGTDCKTRNHNNHLIKTDTDLATQTLRKEPDTALQRSPRSKTPR